MNPGLCDWDFFRTILIKLLLKYMAEMPILY